MWRLTVSEMWLKQVDRCLQHSYQLVEVQEGWIYHSLQFHLSGENENSKKINKNQQLVYDRMPTFTWCRLCDWVFRRRLVTVFFFRHISFGSRFPSRFDFAAFICCVRRPHRGVLLYIFGSSSLSCLLFPARRRGFAVVLNCRSWGWRRGRGRRQIAGQLRVGQAEELVPFLLLNKELQLITPTCTPARQTKLIEMLQLRRKTLEMFMNTHLWLINFVVRCRPSSSMNPCRDSK